MYAVSLSYVCVRACRLCAHQVLLHPYVPSSRSLFICTDSFTWQLGSAWTLVPCRGCAACPAVFIRLPAALRQVWVPPPCPSTSSTRTTSPRPSGRCRWAGYSVWMLYSTSVGSLMHVWFYSFGPLPEPSPVPLGQQGCFAPLSHAWRGKVRRSVGAPPECSWALRTRFESCIHDQNALAVRRSTVLLCTFSPRSVVSCAYTTYQPMASDTEPSSTQW